MAAASCVQRWRASFGYVRATEISASVGQFVAYALGFIGLMYNPILIFIAIFVYLAASSEAHMVALRAVSRGVPVSYAMMTQFATLTPDAHIDEAVQTLLATSQGEFPVVDGAGKPVGVLDRGGLVRALKTLGPDARVSEAMNPEMPTVGYRFTLEQAFKLLQEKSAPAVGVIDAAGKLSGLVTNETIAEMMMLNEAAPRGWRVGPWGRPAGGLEQPSFVFARCAGLFPDYIALQQRLRRGSIRARALVFGNTHESSEHRHYRPRRPRQDHAGRPAAAAIRRVP